MVPSFHSGNDIVWIGSPSEGFRIFVGFREEAIDGGLEVDEGVEDAALDPTSSEFGEETLDGVQPRTGCWREVEHKPVVAIEPSPNLWMLMGGVIVEDDVDGFVGRDLSVDHVEEADELLVPVTLHITSDHGSVENVQSCEERRGSVTLVIVDHGSQTSFFHRQARLGAVKCLYLAFLIDGQNDGMGRRINIKPNDIAQFSDEVRIARELELPIAVRLQTMRSPDAADRAFTDADRGGHHQGRPMGRLDRRVRQRQRHDALGHVRVQGRNTRRARFVAEKAINISFVMAETVGRKFSAVFGFHSDGDAAIAAKAIKAAAKPRRR